MVLAVKIDGAGVLVFYFSPGARVDPGEEEKKTRTQWRKNSVADDGASQQGKGQSDPLWWAFIPNCRRSRAARCGQVSVRLGWRSFYTP